jgi:short-subunit dehydrogenase
VGQDNRNVDGECIVTGASEGIGAAFARVAARRGRSLLLVARRGAMLDALAAEIRSSSGVPVRTLAADLGVAEGIDALVATALADGRRPSMLINNAGFGLYGDVTESDERRLVEMLRLNIEAVVVLSRRLAPAMIGVPGAAILNIASTAAFQACPGFGTYAATKAFVLAFTEALHIELEGKIRVTAVCPGYTESGFHAVAGLDLKTMKLPIMTAEEVAEQAWRASDAAACVHVSGMGNKVLVAASGVAPRALSRRIAGKIFRRNSFGR